MPNSSFNPSRNFRRPSPRAFALLEVLLAVGLFAIALIGLGRATGDMLKINLLRR
jgi:Tfp pilus assembly protein PilV